MMPCRKDTIILVALMARGKWPGSRRKNGRKKTVTVSSYHWRKDGVGWEFRKSVYVETDVGIRKHRLPFIAHLSNSAFGELKRHHKGAALEKAIAEWIAERDQ
jgi:hypothetical protein